MSFNKKQVTTLMPTFNGQLIESDADEAEVFIKYTEGKFLQLDRLGTRDNVKLIWDGQKHKWVEDPSNGVNLFDRMSVEQLKEAQDFVREANKLVEQAVTDDEKASAGNHLAQMKFYMKIAIDYRNKKNCINAIFMAAAKVTHNLSEFDVDPYLLNTPDGPYDLRTMKLTETPNNFFLKSTAVAPRYSLENMEEWKAALRRWTCEDEAYINFLQLELGKCLIGKAYLGMDIAWGDGGNGKGALINTVQELLGDYAISVPKEIILKGPTNKKFYFVDLQGVRFVVIPEVEKGQVIDDGALKIIASRDIIVAEYKHGRNINFKPTHNCVWYVNNLPRVQALDKGTWDRLTVLPFDAEIRGTDNDIPDFEEHLIHNLGPTILWWLMEGAKKFIEQGEKITAPERIRKATARYKAENDTFVEFCEEYLEEETEERKCVLSKNAYVTYCRFCADNKYDPLKKSQFFERMESAGFAKKFLNDGYHFLGVKLSE